MPIIDWKKRFWGLSKTIPLRGSLSSRKGVGYNIYKMYACMRPTVANRKTTTQSVFTKSTSTRPPYRCTQSSPYNSQGGEWGRTSIVGRRGVRWKAEPRLDMYTSCMHTFCFNFNISNHDYRKKLMLPPLHK